ncbi:ABC transporter ATP-binding protein [Mesorhizobium sp. INR15]|uniref:ABC transporter ATP-binding protein n=1 Tax=Mesorhizobium sp. INR15 TaxID=2654248 RepID=UPI0018964CD0|nr:ABC transporter ATP-binding protein [Mesorhizobium sp. INR15]QPC94321.1 ATP-binding cassette domain-containing protein [Mesorhizobium sp. INR15]
MDVVLKVDGLTKSYGRGADAVQVLGGISFEVRRGEFVSVVGPSGCGKTTLLFAIAGLHSVTSGSVSLKGQLVTAPPKGVAVVFQDYSRSLFPWKNNRDNVAFGTARINGLSAADKRGKAQEILEAVGLTGFGDKYPWQLSGGMQQRVAIARALASQSELLLLDEPLAAVDAQTRADMQDLLLDIAIRFQQTCLLVTHDVDEAVYMADRVVVLTRRPTTVDHEITVDLGKKRDQIATRENPVFLKARHDVMTSIRNFRAAAPADAAA